MSDIVAEPPPPRLSPPLWHELWRQTRQLAQGFRQRDSLAQNVLWLYVVQLSTYLLPVISLTYLARVFSVETFGLVAYAQAFAANFALLTEYGFNLSATREIAAHREDPKELSRIFSEVMVAKVMLLAVGLVIFTISVLAVPRFAAHKLLLLTAFTITVGYLLFPVWLFQGLQLMKQVAFRDLLAKLVVVLLLVAFVHGDEDILWATSAPAAALMVAGLLGLRQVYRITPVRFVSTSWDGVRRQLAVGWPMFLSSALGSLLLSTGILVVGWQSLEEVGYFNAAFRIASLVRMINIPLQTVLFSHISHKAAQSEAEAVRFVQKYRVLLSLPFLAASALMAATLPWMIPFFFGHRYDMSRLPMAILSFSAFAQAWSFLYSTYFMLPCGYDRQWFRIVVLASTASLLLALASLYLWRGSIALSCYAVISDLLVAVGCRQFYLTRARTLQSSATVS